MRPASACELYDWARWHSLRAERSLPHTSGPGLTAPSGVLLVGLALVLRDLVQRRLGLVWAIGAIILGAFLSTTFTPPSLALASAAAFLGSEIADLSCSHLAEKGLVKAAFFSSIAGLVVDSVMFLWLAFGALDFLAGQVVGKAVMVVAALHSCLDS